GRSGTVGDGPGQEGFAGVARELHAEEGVVPEVDVATGLSVEDGAGDPQHSADRDDVPGDVRTATGGGDVHADDVSAGIEEGAAGVAGDDVGVDLDEAAEAAGATAVVVHGDRLVPRR